MLYSKNLVQHILIYSRVFLLFVLDIKTFILK